MEPDPSLWWVIPTCTRLYLNFLHPLLNPDNWLNTRVGEIRSFVPLETVPADTRTTPTTLAPGGERMLENFGFGQHDEELGSCVAEKITGGFAIATIPSSSSSVAAAPHAPQAQMRAESVKEEAQQMIIAFGLRHLGVKKL